MIAAIIVTQEQLQQLARGLASEFGTALTPEALARVDSMADSWFELAATTHPNAGTGSQLITAERIRQVTEEDRTAVWDQQTAKNGQLAMAASVYALPAVYRRADSLGLPINWPWAKSWWKPGDRVRELAKAGALCAAEIDRLTANQMRDA